MKKYLLAVFILLFNLSNLQAQNKNTSANSLSKVTTNDDYIYIAINQMKMWIGNNGMGSHDPYTDGAGLFWPGGENATISAIFMDGLVWGGKVNGEIRVNGDAYRYGLHAGKVLNSGNADDPSLSKYRIYKIRKDWNELPSGPTKDRYQKDYDEWPGNDGAPFYDSNNDGVYTTGIDKPLFLGDEVLWCVMNDMDTSRSLFTYGSMPIGLEIQLTVYGYTHSSLTDVLFKKYKVINKGNNDITDMYFTYWTDDDLGFAGDDFVGCDTLLNLGYTYNGDSNDEGFYGTPPPAVGHMFVQPPIIQAETTDSARYYKGWIKGFKNLPLTAFSLFLGASQYYDDPMMGDYAGTQQVYNHMQGFFWDGSPMMDPNTILTTHFCVAGDPVSGTGWYEGNGWPNGPVPGDRRFMLTTGKFNMARNDTQEVVIAIIAAQGSDNLQSITELKKTAEIVQYFYNNYVPETVDVNYLPPLPEYYYLGQNYPNPFNPITRISYELPVSGLVTLKLFDILGREISTLVNEEKSAGKYQVGFSSGSLSSGIYFYTLTSREYSKTKKMVVIK
jgi:hypothetical protein